MRAIEILWAVAVIVILAVIAFGPGSKHELKPAAMRAWSKP